MAIAGGHKKGVSIEQLFSFWRDRPRVGHRKIDADSIVAKIFLVLDELETTTTEALRSIMADVVREPNSANRSADRFSSQPDRNSADSGAEILMHGPAEWRGGLE